MLYAGAVALTSKVESRTSVLGLTPVADTTKSQPTSIPLVSIAHTGQVTPPESWLSCSTRTLRSSHSNCTSSRGCCGTVSGSLYRVLAPPPVEAARRVSMPILMLARCTIDGSSSLRHGNKAQGTHGQQGLAEAQYEDSTGGHNQGARTDDIALYWGNHIARHITLWRILMDAHVQ